VYFLYPETSNRTLEDLDAYFDIDSPHKTIIPVGDRVAKQRDRPLEASRDYDTAKTHTAHIEEVGDV
jgi:hypothetical protein